jgi:hypothetical protein
MRGERAQKITVTRSQKARKRRTLTMPPAEMVPFLAIMYMQVGWQTSEAS